MEYENLKTGEPIKFMEGWLEHKSVKNTWTCLWCVLKNNIIYIFTNNMKHRDSHVGTLELGPESRVELGDGDAKSGYKFSLTTNTRINKFKTSKFIERELWRACIEAIATGNVPDTLDLLPGQIQDIQFRMEQYRHFQHLTRHQQHRSDSTNGMSAGFPPQEGFDTPNSSGDGSFIAEQVDQEYVEPVSNTHTWFFCKCDRTLAERILVGGVKHGNALMRESCTHTGALAISKRNDTTGEINHYVVEKCPGGYRLQVENHSRPMRTLAELMDFFVKTAGTHCTRPMTSNNLKLLGIKDNDYHTKIVHREKDNESGEENTVLPLAPPTPHYPLKKGKSADDGSQFSPAPSAQVVSPTHPHLPNSNKGGGQHVQSPRVRNQRSPSVPNISLVTGNLSLTPDHNSRQKRNSVEFISPPPPLPPNHPPPLKPILKKANTETKLSTEKKYRTLPHSHSVEGTSTEPRAQVVEESFVSVSERLKEAKSAPKESLKKTPPAVAPKPTGSSTPSEACGKTPKNTFSTVTPNFMKELENKILEKSCGQNSLTSPPSPTGVHHDVSKTGQTSSNQEEAYESLEHYQNSKQIKEALGANS